MKKKSFTCPGSVPAVTWRQRSHWRKDTTSRPTSTVFQWSSLSCFHFKSPLKCTIAKCTSNSSASKAFDPTFPPPPHIILPIIPTDITGPDNSGPSSNPPGTPTRPVGLTGRLCHRRTRTNSKAAQRRHQYYLAAISPASFEEEPIIITTTSNNTITKEKKTKCFPLIRVPSKPVRPPALYRVTTNYVSRKE
jgi:hypothetical protein